MVVMPTADGKRSFWMHQLAEYVIGFALVATGLQSPEPLVPTLVGALIVLNTACVDAPFGAFRKVGRRLHRVLDIVVFVVVVAACFIPSIDSATRLVMALIAVVFAAVIFRTDYTPPVPRAERHQPGDGRTDDLGRQAGRVAGTLAARARDSWRRRG